MRRTLMGIVFGITLPLSVAHADIASDVKAGQSVQVVLSNALKSNMSVETALQQLIAASPSDAYMAITAAVQLAPDQASNIVKAALARGLKLDPPSVVGAALQGAPDKAGTIVSTAIVSAPSYYTVGIIQHALNAGVPGKQFLAQAIRAAPRQASSILTQALRTAPTQTKAIMEAVIADRRDRLAEYVGIALDAKANPSDVLAGAVAADPLHESDAYTVALQHHVPAQIIAAAGLGPGNWNGDDNAKNVVIQNVSVPETQWGSSSTSSGPNLIVPSPTFGGGGGGGGSGLASQH